jgi:beta-1,2-mannobiose phosphorylase / 1,2-beta-oligomannan phosphorylase
MKALLLLPLVGTFLWAVAPGKEPAKPQPETTAGWVKHPKNPVLGGALGTCFDVAVLKEGATYRMWFSWRPKKSIALVESQDGVRWSKPVITLGPNNKIDWENDLNRPAVLKTGDRYQMWYTGQAKGKSWIGYATSRDGKAWKRMRAKPVLAAEKSWEKVAVMCPHVLYDQKAKLFRMWYSGGEQGEPNAIGYATSRDGVQWAKHKDNRVFQPDSKNAWEKDRVTGCQILRRGGWYVMFYIGFRDESHAQIGLARSRDGITGWQRHRANPVIRPGKDRWDHDAVYKPYALLDGRQWLLWYNGRQGRRGTNRLGVAQRGGPGVLKAVPIRPSASSAAMANRVRGSPQGRVLRDDPGQGVFRGQAKSITLNWNGRRPNEPDR